MNTIRSVHQAFFPFANKLDHWYSILIFALPLLCAGAARASTESDFICGGQIEAEVWRRWEAEAGSFFYTRQLQNRLIKQGDVYALYDFQTYAHNLVSMARRCGRYNRLREVSDLIQVAYGELEEGNILTPGRRWVCRGGSICNNTNRLLGKEVMLDSVQFLALATAVANALSYTQAPVTETNTKFIEDTVSIALEHLLRWGTIYSIKTLQQRIKAKPSDVKDGFASLFYTDKELWQLAIYADLAGILQSPHFILGRKSATAAREEKSTWGMLLDEPNQPNTPNIEESMQQLQAHFGTLLQLFLSRITITNSSYRQGANILQADLDRGFWRLYADNRYAAYTQAVQPVDCLTDGQGAKKYQEVVSINDTPIAQNIGWDISHARRLVHALDALNRNRGALQKQWPNQPFATNNYITYFSNTLSETMWNKDAVYPLFSNYWSGDNGWYRVAYNNGTGQCRTGTPPYGLTDAFPTGGFVAWGSYNDTIKQLGRRLYDLQVSDKAEDSAFIDKHYRSLRTAEGMLMFLPTLVNPQQ